MISISIAIKSRREAKVKPERPTRKVMILKVLTAGDPGGMTADEIEDQLIKDGKILERNPSFTRPRLTELKKDGLVEIIGKRAGNSKCRMAVWRVVKR